MSWRGKFLHAKEDNGDRQETDNDHNHSGAGADSIADARAAFEEADARARQGLLIPQNNLETHGPSLEEVSVFDREPPLTVPLLGWKGCGIDRYGIIHTGSFTRDGGGTTALEPRRRVTAKCFCYKQGTWLGYDYTWSVFTMTEEDLIDWRVVEQLMSL